MRISFSCTRRPIFCSNHKFWEKSCSHAKFALRSHFRNSAEFFTGSRVTGKNEEIWSRERRTLKISSLQPYLFVDDTNLNRHLIRKKFVSWKCEEHTRDDEVEMKFSRWMTRTYPFDEMSFIFRKFMDNFIDKINLHGGFRFVSISTWSKKRMLAAAWYLCACYSLCACSLH